MSASSTRLQEYTNGKKSVFASKITAVDPFTEPHAPPGSMTLIFTKADGRETRSHLVGAWVDVNKPQVGGYFVVEDDSEGRMSCRYMDAASFETAYVKEN